jgi:hypothetical protein
MWSKSHVKYIKITFPRCKVTFLSPLQTKINLRMLDATLWRVRLFIVAMEM